MLKLKEQLDSFEKTYTQNMRYLSTLNEDVAVKLHLKYEKIFEKTLNKMFSDFLVDYQKKVIKPGTFKSNNMAQEYFAEVLPIVPTYEQTMLPEYEYDPTALQNQVPSPSVDSIRTALVDDGQGVDVDESRFAYIDKDATPTSNPDLVGMPYSNDNEPANNNLLTNIMKRTIDPNGKRVD